MISTIRLVSTIVFVGLSETNTIGLYMKVLFCPSPKLAKSLNISRVLLLLSFNSSRNHVM
jgi:hypothetical protein